LLVLFPQAAFVCDMQLYTALLFVTIFVPAGAHRIHDIREVDLESGEHATHMDASKAAKKAASTFSPVQVKGLSEIGRGERGIVSSGTLADGTQVVVKAPTDKAGAAADIADEMTQLLKLEKKASESGGHYDPCVMRAVGTLAGHPEQLVLYRVFGESLKKTDTEKFRGSSETVYTTLSKVWNRKDRANYAQGLVRQAERVGDWLKSAGITKHDQNIDNFMLATSNGSPGSAQCLVDDQPGKPGIVWIDLGTTNGKTGKEIGSTIDDNKKMLKSMICRMKGKVRDLANEGFKWFIGQDILKPEAQLC